jgi:hypothetical protein
VAAVVLVEGESDRAAVRTLAGRRGRDLAAEEVTVVAMAGATNIAHHLDRYGPSGVRLAGLYDAAEERFFRRGLERAGLGSGLDRAGLEALGFFGCDADLEDELIRALGPDAVLEILAAEGELRSFRLFQGQPAQQGRTLTEQLHRFLGTRSGRKIRYGGLLAAALGPDQVPRSLDRLLAYV